MCFKLFALQTQGEKLLSFALPIFDSFFFWWFFLFFFFYQRLSSKAVYVDFMVQTSLLQWIMWYF